MGPTTDRVVILIDMDCFYCQVEEKLNPKLKDKPIAVVQYNAWRGGGIIAVNYPARSEGVTRHMRGNEAKQKCPSIQLVTVPEVRGKADLTKYRDAGKEVADVLATFTPLLQRASVDEAYLDITELVEKRITTDLHKLTTDNLTNTFVVESELKDFLHNVISNKEFCVDKLKLAVGALICEEMRYEVFKKTGYKCSAGIAHNKTLAKLVCSLHKPNKQTILPHDAVEKFFETMPINKIKNLGGKFGQRLSEDFHITFMGQLAKLSEKDLLQKYDEKNANWLHNIAKGIDMEPVTTKLVSKSIACCKNFSGITALTTSESVEHWLHKLAEEMEERLEKDLKENNRKAKQIIVSFSQEINKKDVSSSRTHTLTSYKSHKIAGAAFEIIKKFCLRSDGSYHVKFLGLSASNFEDVKKVREITTFFQVEQSKSDQNNVSKADQSKKIDKNSGIQNNDSAGQKLYCRVEPKTVFVNEMNNESSLDDPGTIQQSNPETVLTKNFKFFEKRSSNVCNSPRQSNVTSKSNKPSFFAKYFVKDPPTMENDELQLAENEIQTDSSQVNTEDNESEICPECQKIIPLTDLTSHQDYHFALKLSKSEHFFEKPKTESVATGKKRGRTKSVKEKNVTNNTLTTFLKNEEDDSTVTETCQECNKKIKIEEIISHMDHHVAKRIHLEINALRLPAKSEKIKKSPVKPTSKMKHKKAKNQSSNRSVVSFFKPT